MVVLKFTSVSISKFAGIIENHRFTFHVITADVVIRTHNQKATENYEVNLEKNV